MKRKKALSKTSAPVERTSEIEAMLAAYEAQLSQEFFAITTGANARGWLRLCEILGEAKFDPVVVLSPGAKEFAELIQRRIGDSIEHVNAEQTFQAVRSDMSKSDGRKSRVKVIAAKEREEAENRRNVEREYQTLEPSRQGRRAASVIGPRLGLSEPTVRSHLKALGHKP